MPLPLTVSCFSKIQIGFTFLVLAHPGSPGQRAVKRVCVCVCTITVYSMQGADIHDTASALGGCKAAGYRRHNGYLYETVIMSTW